MPRRTERKRKGAAPPPLPIIWAEATDIDREGVAQVRTVRMFERLPAWWHRSQEDQRNAWLQAWFARQLPPGERLDWVTCRVGC